MATLMIKRNKHGDRIGQCDESCYESGEDRCDCICKGRNHSVMLFKAMENTMKWFLPIDGQDGVEVSECVKQLDRYCNTKARF